MFKIYDGREEFYQWDSNQKLIIEDPSINEVHFCNRTDDCSLVCEVYEEEGARLVNVPNILLQTDWAIRVYAFCTDHTKTCKTFKVNARTKPADYVYTEDELWTAEKAVQEAIDEAMSSGDFKGDKGDKGDPGEPGKDGADYVLTDDDKAEIAALALELLPDAEEVNY